MRSIYEIDPYKLALHPYHREFLEVLYTLKKRLIYEAYVSRIGS